MRMEGGQGHLESSVPLRMLLLGIRWRRKLTVAVLAVPGRHYSGNQSNLFTYKEEDDRGPRAIRPECLRHPFDVVPSGYANSGGKLRYACVVRWNFQLFYYRTH